MDSCNNLYLVIAHYKYILLIGIESSNTLVLQEKLLFLPFFVESKFIHQMGQSWILKIISILFMIRHYKHIFLTWIHGRNAFVSTIFLTFKFIHQIGQTWILVIISILMVIERDKHIILFGIHSFDSLVLQEKLLFPPFSSESKFIHQMRQTWIVMIISIFYDWAL